MISLIEILKEVLTEIKYKSPRRDRDRIQGPISPTVRDAINNSIDNRWPLNIYYMGDEENAPGRRWVEPYVWGVHKLTQNDVLRAWQFRGQSAATSTYSVSTPMPIPGGWRLFRLDRISNTAPLTSKTFDKPRAKYNPDDKQMSGIKNRVDFDKNLPTDDINPKKPSPTKPRKGRLVSKKTSTTKPIGSDNPFRKDLNPPPEPVNKNTNSVNRLKSKNKNKK